MISNKSSARIQQFSVALLLLVTLVFAGECDASALPVRVSALAELKDSTICAHRSIFGECMTRGGAVKTTTCERVKLMWENAETAKFLLAGAVAGVVSRTAVAPLEAIATVQMVTGGSQGLLAELTNLYTKGGFMGFFNGNFANCLKVAPTRGIQFFAFESLKTRLITYKRTRDNLAEDVEVNISPIERLVAGGLSGVAASCLVYPLEVVKTMLTMYPGKYSGVGGAFSAVVKEQGVKGLFQGIFPTLIAMFPYVGVEFMIYETSKIQVEKILRKMHIETEGNDLTFVLPAVLSLGLGAFAGATAQTAAHPLDVVRKRLQIQGINGNPILYKSTLDCFAKVAGKEGFSALYKGLGPACVATIPGTGIAYITYESMKKVLGLSSV